MSRTQVPRRVLSDRALSFNQRPRRSDRGALCPAGRATETCRPNPLIHVRRRKEGEHLTTVSPPPLPRAGGRGAPALWPRRRGAPSRGGRGACFAAGRSLNGQLLGNGGSGPISRGFWFGGGGGVGFVLIHSLKCCVQRGSAHTACSAPSSPGRKAWGCTPTTPFCSGMDPQARGSMETPGRGGPRGGRCPWIAGTHVAPLVAPASLGGGPSLCSLSPLLLRANSFVHPPLPTPNPQEPRFSAGALILATTTLWLRGSHRARPFPAAPGPHRPSRCAAPAPRRGRLARARLRAPGPSAAAPPAERARPAGGSGL